MDGLLKLNGWQGRNNEAVVWCQATVLSAIISGLNQTLFKHTTWISYIVIMNMFHYTF